MNSGIDPRTATAGKEREPFNRDSYAQMRVLEVWDKYDGRLTWGRGQCLAVLDDGCDLSVPEWQVKMPWGKPKVIAGYNTMEGGEDPMPVPPAYHGTTVAYCSSLFHEGVCGIAYNDYVAHVRCVTQVHLSQDESATIAAALQWVIDRHRDLNITTVNLAPVDDQRHAEPWPSAIDDKLKQLRALNIWVSAPCANHGYTDGISWPACQPYCFAIGAAVPGKHEVHLDRFSNTDLLVVAKATSSSNSYAVGCSMVLREAIEKSNYPWQQDGETLPDAMMAIFQKTGVPVHDPATGLDFREIDLLAAVDSVMER